MHAERHPEVLENKGGGRLVGGVDFVKLRETGNIVNFFNA
jgi:hypothetical protein